MSKKARITMRSIGAILLVFMATAFIVLTSIRTEFERYLDRKYSQQSFKVGFTKIDIIYGNYYANVVCLNDEVSFNISKKFKTKDIRDGYSQMKSQIQYNSKIKNVFAGSDIESDIRSVTGGGKISFENNATYEQINISLIDGADHIKVIKRVLNILIEKNIAAKQIMIEYEKDNGVYELLLSGNDYNLTEKEIESKVKKIK